MQLEYLMQSNTWYNKSKDKEIEYQTDRGSTSRLSVMITFCLHSFIPHSYIVLSEGCWLTRIQDAKQSHVSVVKNRVRVISLVRIVKVHTGQDIDFYGTFRILTVIMTHIPITGFFGEIW
jgi:hypothetical protein